MANMHQAAVKKILTGDERVLWHIKRTGEQEFLGGRDDWEGAARVAKNCPQFCPDLEDEFVADEPRSCYNCRYRRWTTTSFICLKRVKGFLK